MKKEVKKIYIFSAGSTGRDILQIINQIKYKDIPKNLIIRASGIKIDGQPPKFWKWTSTVHTKNPIGYVCPAYLQDRQCKACRTCWHRSVKQVSYKEH